MEGIQINSLKPSSIADRRGPTYEWCKGLLGQQITIFYRKTGIIAGNHYHKGDDPSKNPEIFFLAKGEVIFNALNGFTGETLEERITKGTEIIIQPGILHSMTILKPTIYIEYRSTIFNPQLPDTYNASTYQEYIKQLSMKNL
ncbi:hypothetical protein HYX11_02050 [Candidatus Woesearchaeota archaeon]|nr:hypothetical protein [Candidatus Woesearchaeota archaeon]